MKIDNKVLQIIRSVYRLSRREMSLLLDISESHLWRIEKDERSLTPDVRQRAVEEFALTPEKLQRILTIYEEYAV